MRFAVVKSQFNAEITEGLLKGAKEYLSQIGAPLSSQDIYEAPGAFEIPLIAKRLAATQKYDGVICLGCVIKGDTAHFEYISLAATLGISQASLESNIPITFGILTTYTEDQALARSRSDAHNKGIEAAQACYSTAKTLKSI